MVKGLSTGISNVLTHIANANPSVRSNGMGANHGNAQTNSVSVNWRQRLDEIADEEVANAATEREARRQAEYGDQSYTQGMVDQIANEEIANAERKREAERKAAAERGRKLSDMVSDELAKAARSREAKRQEDLAKSQASLVAQEQARNRVGQIAAEEVSNAAETRQGARDMAAQNQARVNQIAAEEVDNASDRRRNARAARNELVESTLRSAKSAVEARDRRTGDLEDMIFDMASEAVYGPVPKVPGLESYGYVDPETGEIVSNQDGEQPQRTLDDILPRIADHHMGGRHIGDAGNSYSGSRHRISTEDMLDSMLIASREMAAEEDANSGTTNFANPMPPSDPNNPPRTDPQDISWRGWQDVTGLHGDRARRNRIVRYEAERMADAYRLIHEDDGQALTDFDAQDHGYVEFDFDADESRSHLMRRLSNARNMVYERFMNPTLLRIEGEWVETQESKVNGRTRTYGRIRYSTRVEGAIGGVRRVYNCSIFNVMQLVQLRAGLGVDSKGKIANVDPNEFRLTEDQFVELCRDIVESQKENGHPLGPVTGTPGANGVRDDTGRYVVVAKTRCFPMGYIPTQLMRDLRRDWNSQLHHMSERQIVKAVGEQWINETYPTLCANTGGNLMYQARAIENMMRGLMMLDGKNPSDLGIPEVIERQTLMALRAETAATVDPDVQRANEIKHQRVQSAMSRFMHSYRKQGGSRFADGDMQSAATKRRRNKVGDGLRALNMLEKAAKAANIGIMISSVPEAVVAHGEQKLAVLLSDAVFRGMHGDIARQYEMTDDLEALSQTNEAIEARGVAESLYRIGGWDAIDAFLGSTGDDGRVSNRLTNSDLRRFLQEIGVTGSEASVSERVREMFHVGENEDAGFLSNVSHIVDGLEDMVLGSGMFKRSESSQFVRMSMAEMARLAAYNQRMSSDAGYRERMLGRGYLSSRESYTNEQVADWGRIGGGEEMVRSLMRTDAGREAFMTQGITSLGRKSPVEHQMRLIMAKNGLTEFMVRTFFDRFPEYGVNKIMQMIPFSNTLSYLSSYGIGSIGDLLEASRSGGTGDNALTRNFGYQSGSRTASFTAGLRKNLLYDTVMAGEKLLLAGIYCGIIQLLGGLQPPDDEKDRYTWSEWKIGDGENAVPVKWAWWMDDLSGVGLPLGMSWAICIQGGWSPEAKQTAGNVFINAIANFNSGTALFDAIDLINNFDQEWEAALGMNMASYEPSFDEWAMTMLEQGFWDLVGDLTPTFIGQLVPWSRDYLFAGNRDAHTAGRVYDAGDGSRYSMDEAVEGYHTRQTGSYSDYMRRRSSQTNILQAIFNDWFLEDGQTGYKYTEQPLDTMVDPYVQSMYDMFYLDTSSTSLPLDQKKRQEELYERAEVVCQWIDEHYQNATQANLDGFVLNYDARVNCINYCYLMIDMAWDEYNDAKGSGWLEDDEYDRIVENRQSKIEHYQNLIHEYFQSDEIPWSLPRYVRQESDRETRYVDDQGNPMTYLDTLGPDAKAHREGYWYGNVPSILPLTSPVSSGKGYNYETIPYWAVTDADGNPVGDIGSTFDNAANMVVNMGRNAGMNVQELMWGGQGTNSGPTSDERLNISREGVPTVGSRPWRVMTETFPESLKNLDSDTVSKVLGIPSSMPSDDDKTSTTPTNGDGEGNGRTSYYPRYYGGGYYGGSSYSGGGGGYSSSYSSSYNPRIYSTPRQVNGDRAAGLSTRQPYKATTTYLRPNFYTKGSREAYKRSDI